MARGLLAVELLVQQEDEKVHVDAGFVEHFHDGHTLILQLQQVLCMGNRQNVS